MMHELREWINFAAELYICWILTKEYIYDKNLNEHIKAMKRRVKKHLDFENLTTGESK